MAAILWKELTKGMAPAEDPAVQPWNKVEEVWCEVQDRDDVPLFCKGVNLKNGGRLLDTACGPQCTKTCRYFNLDFQREHGAVPFQSKLKHFKKMEV